MEQKCASDTEIALKPVQERKNARDIEIALKPVCERENAALGTKGHRNSIKGSMRDK